MTNYKIYKCFMIIIIITIVFLNSVISFSQWQNIGPGAGSDLEAMAIQPNNPDVVYIGGDIEGIFKTTNGGVTWQNINNNLSNDFKDPGIYFIEEIIIDPGDATYNTIYICTLDGLFRSINGGGHWTLLYPKNPVTENDFVPISYLTIDPSNSNILWAGIGEAHASLDGIGK